MERKFQKKIPRTEGGGSRLSRSFMRMDEREWEREWESERERERERETEREREREKKREREAFNFEKKSTTDLELPKQATTFFPAPPFKSTSDFCGKKDKIIIKVTLVNNEKIVLTLETVVL